MGRKAGHIPCRERETYRIRPGCSINSYTREALGCTLDQVLPCLTGDHRERDGEGRQDR